MNLLISKDLYQLLSFAHGEVDRDFEIKMMKDLLDKNNLKYKLKIYKSPERFKFRIPKLSATDTLAPRGFGEAPRSEHGTAQIVEEKYIEKMYNKLAKIIIENQYRIYLSESGKWVFQQPGTRACTAGVSTMLLLDIYHLPIFSRIECRNISNDRVIREDLISAGIDKKKIVRKEYNLADKDSLEMLKLDLQKHSMQTDFDSIGGHVAILDNINIGKKILTFRDPYNAINFDIKIEDYINLGLYGSSEMRCLFIEN